MEPGLALGPMPATLLWKARGKPSTCFPRERLVETENYPPSQMSIVRALQFFRYSHVRYIQRAARETQKPVKHRTGEHLVRAVNRQPCLPHGMTRRASLSSDTHDIAFPRSLLATLSVFRPFSLSHILLALYADSNSETIR